MPFVVALTGGIGSGKTAVSDRFARLGAEVVDTDVIARELTAPEGAAMAEIRSAFGAEVIAPDGSLDRARMRALAFSDLRAKHTLEGVLHPMIRERSRARVRASTAPYVVLVVPLLVESGNWRARADRVLVVDCPVETQIERAMRRSNLSREAAMRIVEAQATRAERLAAADDVIENTAGLECLDRSVAELDQRYRTLAAGTCRDATNA